MRSTFLQFAQIAPNAEEVTVGQALSGLLVLAALTGSAATMAAWAARIRRGDHVFPAAARKPLFVPVPLLFIGTLLTIILALITIGSGPATRATEPPAGVGEIEQPSDGNQRSDNERSSDIADENQNPARRDDTRVAKMLIDTLTMNLVMILVFGTAIAFAQQNRSRRLTSLNDLTYADFSDTRFAIPADTTDDRELSSTDAAPDPAPSTVNPFQAPTEPAPADSDIVPSNADSELSADAEPWRLKTELRFAAETVLVAYLPTAMLRILILNLLPDSPSHPFLTMMEQGIDWTVMLLIGIMAVVIAPVMEELLYRVTILGGFIQQRASLTGWIVSSILFGFAHGFPDSVALLPLAFAIGYAYLRRRSYRTVILIHFLFNSFNMLIAGISLMTRT